ncbi:MAG TPA: Ig-like domain-containing protein [Candidatus Limnocylindrales bacterium]|nr:Ig-like domain-containing protein [Candidatus Limnocylindrales bacterium]
MKTPTLYPKAGLRFILPFAILTFGAKALAQTTDSNLIPVVTVEATQPIATATNPGVFTVFRAGNTNATLNVWFDLSGTASNGVDYAAISNHLVEIAAGATSNTITITPIESAAVSVVKTVVLTLTNSPLLTPVNYEIGSPSGAIVYVENGGATNLPPSVSIIEPKDGDAFYTPTNIQLLAKATDPDGSVTHVEFFAGTNDLGSGVMVVLDPPGVNGVTGPVWFFNWLNPPPGGYLLTAVATDNGGASTISTPVNITVLQGLPTNLPPVVRIVSPANGSVFRAPIKLPLYAFASDPDGSVTSVQFFAGANSLGFGQRLPVVEPLASGNVIVVGGPPPPIYPTNLFLLIWTNAPVGTNVLTAVATDNGGLSTTSAPVNITILPPLPPPTNRPPIVSMVATDPIAIEGTNCWVWPGETNSPPTWAAWPTAVCRPFTNCGPKTATFTVRRFGDTNADLTVTYAIGGTASNGVDYIALPDFVTIPAGERRALITIVPIDDGPPDVNKTVILTLTPSTNTPPDYLLGFPRCAAAIILDPKPCAASSALPGGCFHFTAPGPDAAWFYVQCSTDLVNWTTICTNQVINGSIDFVDPDAAGNPSRFYRAVPLNNAPAE